jgi:hypothetical protein
VLTGVRGNEYAGPVPSGNDGRALRSRRESQPLEIESQAHLTPPFGKCASGPVETSRAIRPFGASYR